ncbi:hypothetical protein QCA50_004891 [Cerrena zonata]|uniref:Wax synthase domain-containing protein n=1 Tax=Cerrena zonata TaxID=2478898 RepID=A0AAW0GFV1_9APHY
MTAEANSDDRVTRPTLTTPDAFTRMFEIMLNFLVPGESERYELTLKTAPLAFAYYVPLQLLAYLSRRGNTRNLRFLLLPVTLIMIVIGTFWFGKPYDPDTFFLELIRGLSSLTCIAQALDFTFAGYGRRKVGETTLPPLGSCTPEDTTEVKHAGNGHHSRNNDQKGRETTWYQEVAETMCAMRGIGWNFGKGVVIPPEERDLNKGPFLRDTFFAFLKGYIIIDTIQMLFANLPSIGSFYGASIFYPELSPLSRYALSTVLHILVGVVVDFSLQTWYHLTTLFCVGVLGQSPVSWPPVFGKPWLADSLHVLWAREWHQLLRRTFMVLGGIPGSWIAGRAGMVMGSFIASGLYHECGMYLLNRGVHWRVPLFFTLQGVGVICEDLFKRVTGKRVSGWAGRIWVAFFMVFLAQICTDSWISRGMANVRVLPSLARIFLAPPIRWITGLALEN